MKPADRRRVLASVAALLAMPFLFICNVYHYCMCGHMAHPPCPWYYLANDFAWLSLLVVAFVFAIRSNIPLRAVFIVETVLTLTLRFTGHETLSIFVALALVVASVLALRGAEQDEGRSNSSSEAITKTATALPQSLCFYFVFMGIFDAMSFASADLSELHPAWACTALVWFWLAYELYRRKRRGRIAGIILCGSLLLGSVYFATEGAPLPLLSMVAVMFGLPLAVMVSPRAKREFSR